MALFGFCFIVWILTDSIGTALVLTLIASWLFH